MIEIDKVKIDPYILSDKESFTLHVVSIIKSDKIKKITIDVDRVVKI